MREVVDFPFSVGECERCDRIILNHGTHTDKHITTETGLICWLCEYESKRA